MATSSYYSITFDYGENHYEGRVTPELKAHHTHPSSYHVVLNEVFFGYVHKDNNKWHVDEQRPADLVQAVGRQIEQIEKNNRCKQRNL